MQPTDITTLVPALLHAIFTPEDTVRIAIGNAGNSVKLKRDAAVQHILDNSILASACKFGIHCYI